jgi:sulfur carrier protein
MIEFSFNGEALQLPHALNLQELLAQRGLAERRVAIERNGQIVPRSQHANVLVEAGDRIEVVMAIGGG